MALDQQKCLLSTWLLLHVRPVSSGHLSFSQEALNVNRIPRGCVASVLWMVPRPLVWSLWSQAILAASSMINSPCYFFRFGADNKQWQENNEGPSLFPRPLLYPQPPWEKLPILKELPLQSNVALMKNTYPQAFFQPVLLMWPLLNCVPLFLISVNKCN